MTARTPRRRTLAAAALLLTALAASACAPLGDPADDAGTIGLLLPESQTTRYETSDRPAFEQVVSERCADCRVLTANAAEDPARQQDQAEAMIVRGADVLVLDAVDPRSALSIIDSAERHGVDVIAYDRFIDDPRVSYYVSFDSERIGYQQARAALDALRAVQTPGSPPAGVLLLNGSATDPNAAALKAGAHRALREAEVTLIAEYDTPRWSPTLAQDWVTGKLTQHGRAIDAVIAANDGLAGGAIAAFTAAGVSPIPPVTGEDAELAAVQRIVNGEQLMTVAKATAQQARTAAEVAVRLLRGESPVAPTSIGGVPSFLLDPTPVHVEDIARVIVQGRVHTVEEICTPDYAAGCIGIGLLDPADGEDGAP